MKYYKRLKVYKANNVYFNPETIEAESYGWWEFLKVIGGKVVFNDYRYSVTTTKHQSKVKGLLRGLDIKVDLYVQAPEGLQSLQSAITYIDYQIEKLQAEIDKPRSHRAKNDKRETEIYDLTVKKGEVLELIDLQYVIERDWRA